MERSRLGFIGAGGITERHVGVLEQFPDVRRLPGNAGRRRAGRGLHLCSCLYPIITSPDWEDPTAFFEGGLWDVIPEADGTVRRVLATDAARALRNAQRVLDPERVPNMPLAEPASPPMSHVQVIRPTDVAIYKPDSFSCQTVPLSDGLTVELYGFEPGASLPAPGTESRTPGRSGCWCSRSARRNRGTRGSGDLSRPGEQSCRRFSHRADSEPGVGKRGRAKRGYPQAELYRYPQGRAASMRSVAGSLTTTRAVACAGSDSKTVPVCHASTHAPTARVSNPTLLTVPFARWRIRVLDTTVNQMRRPCSFPGRSSTRTLGPSGSRWIAVTIP